MVLTSNMHNARIEEVSDSDPEIDDPSTYLPDSDLSIIAPADIPPPTSTARAPPPRQQQQEPSPHPILQPQGPSANQQSREAIKPYCTIYPLYFSSTRTRATGRRVASHLATENPLAYTILHSLPSILAPHMLPTAFEPDKTHPKDWSNPGRVRVQLFDEDTHAPLHPNIKSKAHLFILIAKYLQSHPTTEDDPLKLRIQGLPVPEGGVPPPAVPRKWKINSILPLHSPAVSGGGVSDNFFKEAMDELRQAQAQGGAGGTSLPPGMEGMAGMLGGPSGPGGTGGTGEGSGSGAGKKKKDKKKS